MKKINRVLGVIIVSVVLFISGCQKNDPVISTADRDKLIGTWDGKSDGSGGHRDFSLVITASNSAPDQVIMQNFDGGTGAVYASVSGNSISIPSQIVSGETIKGSGSYSAGVINFTFTVDDGQAVEGRTGTAKNKH